MPTFFISDLHLDKKRPTVAQALFQWLDTIAATADALYILGDFFDVWVGDDDDDPFAQDIINHLRAFSDTGVPLAMMHGNRDFLLGEKFMAMAGATLIADPTTIDLYGEHVLLMHGDSLCTQDVDYLTFRRQTRDLKWQRQLLARPLQQRRTLAQQMRAQSKSINSLKAEDIMDVTPAEVVRNMRQQQVYRLIHGHTHRPARHALTLDGHAAERIVLGDWGSQGWCLCVSGDGYQLQHWDIPSRSI